MRDAFFNVSCFLLFVSLSNGKRKKKINQSVNVFPLPWTPNSFPTMALIVCITVLALNLIKIVIFLNVLAVSAELGVNLSQVPSAVVVSGRG